MPLKEPGVRRSGYKTWNKQAELRGNIVWRFGSVFLVRCWSALMPWPLQGQRIFRIMGR